MTMLMVAAEALLFFFLFASFQSNLNPHSWAVYRHPCAGTESSRGRGRFYTPTRDSARRDAYQRKETGGSAEGEGQAVPSCPVVKRPQLSQPAEVKPVVSSHSLHPLCCATRDTMSTATQLTAPLPSPPPARDRHISRLPCRAQPQEG